MELNFETMQSMQAKLQQQYRDKWAAISPKRARDKLLWMMIEAGEMADVIKKSGDERIMHDREVRTHFIEEMCGTLMYLNDVTLCYEITPDELCTEYLRKHARNMKRW